MNTRIFHGATQVDAIPADDRGLAYGDGLFETMRTHCGRVPWWEAHWARLVQGAQRLRMHVPDRAVVEAQVANLFADAGDGVLKLIVTRGGGGRGYAPSADPVPTWVLSRHPLPPASRAGGLVLRWCDTRLALQPTLAGLKHCNRLEQVLARGEWDDPGTDEGLLCSIEGDVVSATAANLFVLRHGQWHTPRIDRCGVAGICRDWIMRKTGAEQVRLSVMDVETADALVLCNAVRGILGVSRLGDRAWLPHPAVAALRQQLATANPAFTETAEDA
jgi:4-amino-4-deoxychorismate lyase